jgi:hypothetical protein
MTLPFIPLIPSAAFARHLRVAFFLADETPNASSPGLDSQALRRCILSLLFGVCSILFEVFARVLVSERIRGCSLIAI